MGYNERESSNYAGIPIYLFEFRLLTKYWRYTSADQAVSMLGEIWTSVAITDDGVKQSGDSMADALKITMPTATDIVNMFIGTPPMNPIFITIRRYHFGDTEAAVCYVGEVASINSASPVASIVTCNTLSASLERNGLRLAWARGCPHALYDGQCRVNKETHRLDAVLDGVGGDSITSPDFARFPADWFAGGFIEWADSLRGIERRAIEAHNGNRITIFGTVAGLAGGMSLKVYPGCARTTAACQNKFNNLDNYGGIPSMPDRSPFDGSPVF